MKRFYLHWKREKKPCCAQSCRRVWTFRGLSPQTQLQAPQIKMWSTI